MNERIKRLREQSLKTHPSLSAERAILMTEFYQSAAADQVSIPEARALAFQYLMERKTIWIGKDELIVGERGPSPKAAPTYPEICIHTPEDLDIINSREKISFRVDEKTKNIYADTIIPFWQGRSIRDKIMKEMSPEWKEAFSAGVFTEFMEQRAPGHTVLDDKIYRKGMLDFKNEINARITALDFYNDPEALSKKEELTAMSFAADALITFAKRHAEKAQLRATQGGSCASDQSH